MIYAILILIMVIMAGATFCAICKPGKKDKISKYDQNDK